MDFITVSGVRGFENVWGCVCVWCGVVWVELEEEEEKKRKNLTIIVRGDRGATGGRRV